jgi:hypothetical protein
MREISCRAHEPVVKNAGNLSQELPLSALRSQPGT